MATISEQTKAIMNVAALSCDGDSWLVAADAVEEEVGHEVADIIRKYAKDEAARLQVCVNMHTPAMSEEFARTYWAARGV